LGCVVSPAHEKQLAVVERVDSVFDFSQVFVDYINHCGTNVLANLVHMRNLIFKIFASQL
jgi:hypothetical protein